MITTLYRPPALKCGGVNALQPLNRDCNVVEGDVCTPVEPLPIGVWWDGLTLLWDNSITLRVFGLDVLANSDFDAEIEPLRDVDEVGMSFASLDLLLGFDSQPEPGSPFGSGYEHYFGYLNDPPGMFSAAAAIHYRPDGSAYTGYKVGNQSLRFGLAARLYTGNIQHEDFYYTVRPDSLTPETKAVLFLPFYPKTEVATVSLQVHRESTGELLTSVPATLRRNSRVYAYNVEFDTDALESEFGDEWSWRVTIAREELAFLGAQFDEASNPIDRVFTKYIDTPVS